MYIILQFEFILLPFLVETSL